MYIFGRERALKRSVAFKCSHCDKREEVVLQDWDKFCTHLVFNNTFLLHDSMTSLNLAILQEHALCYWLVCCSRGEGVNVESDIFISQQCQSEVSNFRLYTTQCCDRDAFYTHTFIKYGFKWNISPNHNTFQRRRTNWLRQVARKPWEMEWNTFQRFHNIIFYVTLWRRSFAVWFLYNVINTGFVKHIAHVWRKIRP